MSSEAKCPFPHAAARARSNADWWPEQLSLKVLHQHAGVSDPMGPGFDYAKEFKGLDLAAVTTGRCSSAWPGTAPARTASATAAAAQVAVSSGSHR